MVNLLTVDLTAEKPKITSLNAVGDEVYKDQKRRIFGFQSVRLCTIIFAGWRASAQCTALLMLLAVLSTTDTDVNLKKEAHLNAGVLNLGTRNFRGKASLDILVGNSKNGDAKTNFTRVTTELPKSILAKENTSYTMSAMDNKACASETKTWAFLTAYSALMAWVAIISALYGNSDGLIPFMALHAFDTLITLLSTLMLLVAYTCQPFYLLGDVPTCCFTNGYPKKSFPDILVEDYQAPRLLICAFHLLFAFFKVAMLHIMREFYILSSNRVVLVCGGNKKSQRSALIVPKHDEDWKVFTQSEIKTPVKSGMQYFTADGKIDMGSVVDQGQFPEPPPTYDAAVAIDAKDTAQKESARINK